MPWRAGAFRTGRRSRRGWRNGPPPWPTCASTGRRTSARSTASHVKAGRHAVVMEPAHYQGLLRPGAPSLVEAPQWDPAYQALGAVEIRDLAIYEALSAIG